MKRKIFYLITTAVVFAFVLFACRRNTLDIPVEKVTLDLATATLNVNGTLTLVVTIEPEDAFNQLVKWKSSNTAVATVNDEGVVTAKSGGEATIIVTSEDGGFTATCTITVIRQAASITISQKPLSLIIGNEKILTATILPTDASNKTVKWTSNNNTIATVNPDNGTVTGMAVGTAIIKATSAQDETVFDECVVTVTNVPVLDVKLDKYYAALNTTNNKSLKLTATVLPTNADQSIRWESSNTDVATVTVSSDNSALVTVKSASDIPVSITAISNADPTKKATCEIMISAPYVSVEEIFIVPPRLSFTLGVDGPALLTPSFSPQDPTNKTVNWESGDDAIASVERNADNTATVTPKAVGSTKIFAFSADGGKTASCNVSVIASVVPVEGVSLPLTFTITGSVPQNLTATITPTTATNNNVRWTSSNTAVATVPSVATLNTDGLITPLTVGTTKITVTTVDGNKTSLACTVTVEDVPVTGVTIELDEDELEFDLSVSNDPIKLNAIVGPEDLINDKVIWTTSDNDVATVSSSGFVSPHNVGTATITATTEHGSKKADCEVTVK